MFFYAIIIKVRNVKLLAPLLILLSAIVLALASSSNEDAILNLSKLQDSVAKVSDEKRELRKKKKNKKKKKSKSKPKKKKRKKKKGNDDGKADDDSAKGMDDD